MSMLRQESMLRQDVNSETRCQCRYEMSIPDDDKMLISRRDVDDEMMPIPRQDADAETRCRLPMTRRDAPIPRRDDSDVETGRDNRCPTRRDNQYPTIRFRCQDDPNRSRKEVQNELQFQDPKNDRMAGR